MFANGSIIFLLLPTLYGIQVVVHEHYIEYYRKPTSLTIYDQGIVLHYRRLDDIQLGWNDILNVQSIPGPTQTKWGQHVGIGLIRLVQDKKIIELNYEIVELIKEQHYKATGHMPKKWNE